MSTWHTDSTVEPLTYQDGGLHITTESPLPFQVFARTMSSDEHLTYCFINVIMTLIALQRWKIGQRRHSQELGALKLNAMGSKVAQEGKIHTHQRISSVRRIVAPIGTDEPHCLLKTGCS